MLPDLVASEGPFISVYFDATYEPALRWRALRDQLEADGADGTILLALDGAARRDSGPGRALITSGDNVVVNQDLPVPPENPIARLSTLPYLLPLVQLSEPLVPHVIVQVDELGADLRAIDATGQRVAVATAAARHYDDVTDEITMLVRRLGAQLVVLTGRPTARWMLRSSLPIECQRLVVEVDPGARDIRQLATRANPDQQRRAVQRFRSESARFTGMAVHGMRETTNSLIDGRVDTLLLTDTVVGGRTTLCHRADEVLPQLAIANGADIVLVGSHLTLRDDVGVLLRPASQ